MPDSLPPLDPEMWVRVQHAFDQAVDRDPPESEEVLARLDATDADVAKYVRRMLQARNNDQDSVLEIGAGPLLEALLADRLEERRFGPYRLEKELGRGGMGAVYLARHDTTGEAAAIKIVPLGTMDRGRIELLVRETRLLASLSHPGIARLKHADRTPDGTPWFAMEYVPGIPIDRWVEVHRPGWRAIVGLFGRLCEAVEHAHRHPIVHRDLKPANVLVTGDGDPKLLDFGIAARLQADLEAAEGPSPLTAAYAAPEQLRGEPGGTGVDVYALGVILHELLMERRPYELTDRRPGEYQEVIRDAWPPSLNGRSDLPPIARRDLEAVLAAALAPDAADRYPSAEALGGDIARVLSNRPIRRRRTGALDRLGKLVRRRPGAVAALGASGIVAAGALFLHERALAAERDQAVAEAARTERIRRFVADLFEGGTAAEDVSEISVATLVGNGVREAMALTTDSVLQTDLLATLASMADGVADRPMADSLYRHAVERAVTLYGADDPETLRLQLRRVAALATVDGDAAEGRFREIYAEARRWGDRGHPVAGEAALRLGVFLMSRGTPGEAVEPLEEAVDFYSRLEPRSREHTDALRELGNAYGYIGELPAADSVWSLALPLTESLVGPEHPDVGFLLANLGNLASRRGALEEAEAYQRRSLEVTRAWYGPDHHYSALTAGVLAQTLSRARRFEEAVELSEAVISTLERTPEMGPMAYETSVSRGTLGVALVGLGRDSAALVEYERAAEGLALTVGPNHPGTLTQALNAAAILRRTGMLDSAVVLATNLERRAVETHGPNASVSANARIELGQGLNRQGRYQEAIPVLEAAVTALDSLLGPASVRVQIGRRALLRAFEETGDSAAAEAVRGRLPANETGVDQESGESGGSGR